ncbi:MAG TPA: GEVED domain-containing protein [Flavipsychrobacter sp.]|nr:GEVED domain-containing protein [Flavipsychrobacter sp.]
MKTKPLIASLLFLAIVCLSYNCFSQNILSESFDGATFPPTGWDTAIISYAGCCTSIDSSWDQEPDFTGNPGPASHSGGFYAYYNSFDILSGSSAELYTPALDFSPYTTGYNQVSFWTYCTNFSSQDTLQVYVNTSATSVGGTLLGMIIVDNTPDNGWVQFTYKIPSSYSGTTNYIIFKSLAGDGNSDIYLDDVSVDHVPPCSGMPSISSVSPSGPISVCAGTTMTLTANLPLATGYNFLWQRSRDGGTTWDSLPNTDSVSYTFIANGTAEYRVAVTCTNSGLSDTSSAVLINSSIVKYASLPYIQDFESWINRCDTADVPDSSWTTNPSTGDDSWRRDDQGSTIGGWSSNTGAYTPPAAIHNHSARFHTYDAPFGAQGEMDLFANCSAVTGGKELRLFYINQDGTDSLNIYVSTDNGSTFKQIGMLSQVSSWTSYRFPFASDSGATIIKFLATSDFGATDIGVDAVQILQPCSGKPIAGTVDTVMPCPGINFNLSLSGSSEAAGMSYQWQQSADSITWLNVVGDTIPIAPASIYTPTYFRCIVKCNKSGLSDTSAGLLMNLAPFYLCYCDPTNTITYANANANIGNTTITELPSGKVVLNNGSGYIPALNNPRFTSNLPNNGYLKYDTLTGTHTMYQDSLYRFSVSEIFGSFFDNNPVNIYLDLDHDGTFEGYEQVFDQTVTSSSPSTISDTFRIPDTALVGTTGLRVLAGGISVTDPMAPCGNSDNYGEIDDYLVYIAYQPCNGKVDAGTAVSPDTAMCAGYSYIVVDTTHEYHQSGISWIWQASPDSVSWADISGTTNMDTLTQVFSTTVYHRLKMTCTNTGAVSYSNIVTINRAPAYACYCFSMATGGKKEDSCDVGAFSFGSFAVTKGGPHLHNGAATSGHESYTGTIIDLAVDSTYPVQIYQILKSATHGDAKITLFIDYNNNITYDVPDERVLTAFTTETDFYITSAVTIPDAVLTGVPTGMRLIINDNTNPNSPSDDGCGVYTSGETLDFAIRFHKNPPAGVGNISNIQSLEMYPNPTSGKVRLTFTADNTIKQLHVTVKNLTGQQVFEQSFSDITSQFTTDLDLTNQAKGIYFVELSADGQKMIEKLIVK